MKSTCWITRKSCHNILAMCRIKRDISWFLMLCKTWILTTKNVSTLDSAEHGLMLPWNWCSWAQIQTVLYLYFSLVFNITTVMTCPCVCWHRYLFVSGELLITSPTWLGCSVVTSQTWEISIFYSLTSTTTTTHTHKIQDPTVQPFLVGSHYVALCGIHQELRALTNWCA